jgi:Protein of unknown function (DUF2934)
MPSAQTRSPKVKATPKMTGRGVPVAAKSKQVNSEVRPRWQKGNATSTATGRGVKVAGRSKRGNSNPRPDAGPAVSAQERQILVAQAAYFRAEKRGFAPGGELQDWVEAEAEVLRLNGGA